MMRHDLKRPLRARRNHPLKLLLGVACAALSVAVTHATLMKASTLSELVSRSDYVVRAKVSEKRVRRVEGRHLSEHRLSLLSLYYKRTAAPAPTQLTLQTLGGTLNGLSQRVAGSPSLQVGEELIALLNCSIHVAQTHVAQTHVTQSEAAHQSARCRLVGMGQGLWRATSLHDEDGERLWAPSLEGLSFRGGTGDEALKPLPLSELLKRLAELQAQPMPASQELNPRQREPSNVRP